MQFATDLKNSMPDTLKQVMLPALLAGAGTGALSGYMSAKARPHGETPGGRRRRILRNALVGALLGGTAGATLPVGIKTLTDPVFGPTKGLSPGRRAVEFGLTNAAPVAAGAAGGVYLNKLRGQERAGALKQVLDQVSGATIGKTKIRNEATLRSVLESGGRNDVLRALAGAGKGRSVERMLKGHELLSESGYRGNVLENLLRRPGSEDIWGKLKQPAGGMTEAVRRYVGNQGVLSGPAKSLGLSNLMSKAVGGRVLGRDTTPIAEAYLNWLRPGARRMMGRSGWLGRLGLLGAGVYGAKQLQDAIVGR